MKNYKIKKKLICGKVRDMVLMGTYDGAIKELWQEIATDKDAYYVYSYGKIIDREFKSRYVGLGSWKRYKLAKRENNAPLMGNLKNNRYHKIIVAKCDTREQAARIERDLISFLGRKDLGNGDLYNLTDGGEGFIGYVRTEEHRRKISESLKGENNPNYGKTLSEEHRQKISESLKGENNPNYGRTGQKSPSWKSKNHITDELLFQYLQYCKAWQKEIPSEWGINSHMTLSQMLKNRYGTSSTTEVQKILAERLGKHVLNHESFIQYCNLHKYEFLQMANYFFGISGEQLQRWAARTYSKAKAQTINGWEKRAKRLEYLCNYRAQKRASQNLV